jgi:hypothetical protein
MEGVKMDITIEYAATQDAASKTNDQIIELTDTLLAVVGGGTGEVFLN